MSFIQALEGTAYTEPLNGFRRVVTIGYIQRLKTDHLNQTYSWVPQQQVVRPAPALASWEDNFNLMQQHFSSDYTHVGPSEPLKFSDAALNWTKEDFRPSHRILFKCDACTVSDIRGANVPCTRDGSRTDVWVCTYCSLFNKPCTFTPFNNLREYHGNEFAPQMRISQYPSGPFRFLTFHSTMNPNELAEVFEVSEPLLERLRGLEDEDEENELGEGALCV
ncbi:hypothetical protein DER46DRAFT_658425 [Fusarium sp. MPI-SDFR-AT-0072]|nr:hypothetical protein DER46DRAFT_658425 [Fusarium sp. MPI-SDFR-AT-0072]